MFLRKRKNFESFNKNKFEVTHAKLDQEFETAMGYLNENLDSTVKAEDRIELLAKMKQVYQ